MRLAKLYLSLIIIVGCESSISDVAVPVSNSPTKLTDTYPLSDITKKLLEGVYQVKAGKSSFGGDVVLKWSGEKLSIFTGRSFSYFIFNSGYKDSTIFFEGYWRSAISSRTGLTSLIIENYEGAADLLNGIAHDSITISGLYGNGNDAPTKKFLLEYDYPIKVQNSQFYIIGHRGGGRNIDRLPHSENSLGMIKFAEELGANAVELDVKQTKDGIPVLFHDEYMNKRLIKEDYFIGKISDYKFAQLRTFCTLVNGEKIPTLEEALKTVVENTNIKLVWLDVKDPRSIQKVIEIQQQFLDEAENQNRELEILFGIPDESMLNSFVNRQDFEIIPSLCELDERDVIEANSLAWAPRWSLGLLQNEVEEMHAQGKQVFVWTLDDQGLIKKYLREGNFDGIVTNYPSLTAYEYYRQK